MYESIIRAGRRAALALPLVLAVAAPAAAQEGDAPEGAVDVEEQPWIEVRGRVGPTPAFADVDLEATSDDRHDLWRIRDIQRQWSDALRFGDPIEERSADERLMGYLRNELAEDHFELDRERIELAQARAAGDLHRARVERMELLRAQADLAETRRIAVLLQRIQPSFDEGRATDGDYERKADALARLVRLAENEVEMSSEEAREDREAYLDTLRVSEGEGSPT